MDEITNELIGALEYLLQQTVDADLAHGIELTQGEADARERAINAIAAAKAPLNDMLASLEGFHCKGCERPEAECCLDPCEAVKADRFA